MKNGIARIILVSIFLLLPANLHASQNLDEHSGFNVELGGLINSDEQAMGGGIGFFGLPSKYVSVHINLSFLGSRGLDNYYGGADIGMRLGLGTKISPFIGLGGFAGYIKEYISADDDDKDNDYDGFIDERGEKEEVIEDSLSSIYPEIGVFFWINDETRLCLSGKYHVTTKGRDYDFWLFNIGLSFMVQ